MYLSKISNIRAIIKSFSSQVHSNVPRNIIKQVDNSQQVCFRSGNFGWFFSSFSSLSGDRIIAMPNLDLYNMSGSPSTRAIIMTAKAVGVELTSINVNTFVGEQLKPEFVKINPQHTIPTLVDNGFAIWESRAIVVYLVEKYGKPDSPLYPKDPQKRAVINQRLYFDMGTLYDAFGKYFFPLLRTGKPGTQENLDKLNAAFSLLNTFLEGQDYVAGSQLSVADIVILATVSTIEMVEFDLNKFPNVDRWYKNAQKVTPGWDENLLRIQEAKKFLAANLIDKLP